MEGDESGHRIARQAEDIERSGFHAMHEEKGFARLDLHSPKLGYEAEGGEGGLDVVVVAHADAAAEDDHVAALGEVVDAPDGGIELIGAVVSGGTGQAELSERGGEHRTVAVVELAGLQRLAGGNQFVSGAEDADGRQAMHVEMGDALRSNNPDVRGADALAFPDKDLSGAEVAALAADVLTFQHGVVDRDGARDAGHVFLHDDGIGALGYRRAGENAYRTAGRA